MTMYPDWYLAFCVVIVTVFVVGVLLQMWRPPR